MNAAATLADALWRIGAEDEGLLTLANDDLHHWDDEVREVFTSTGMLVPTTPATRVVCPRCEAGHVEEVMWFDDTKGASHPVVRCQEYGVAVLSPGDLERQRLVPGDLAAEIHRQLRMSPAPRELLRDRAWSVGGPGGENLPVVLARGLSWPDGGSVEAVLSRHDAVVLVFLTHEVRSARDMLLADVVGWQDGALTIDRERLLTARSSVRAAGADQPQYQFLRSGDGWLVAFEGRGFFAKDTKGMGTIHSLLQKPNEWISLIDIVPLAQCGLEMVDEDTIREFRRLARTNEATRQQLQAFLSRVTRPDGSPRVSNSPADRAANNTRMAITRAVEHLRSKDPSLAAHLDRSIRTGLAASYQSDLNLAWET